MKAMIGILFAGGSVALAMASAPATPTATSGQESAQAKHGGKVSPYRPDRFAGRAGTYYRLVWGVDSLAVKSTPAVALRRRWQPAGETATVWAEGHTANGVGVAHHIDKQLAVLCIPYLDRTVIRARPDTGCPD